MGTSCGACENLAEGIHLCHRCTEHLEQDLAEVNTVWEDLQTTIARQDKGADSIGGGHTGSREPINLDALDDGETLTAVLTGWAETLGHPTKNPVQASAVLFSLIREVRRLDWAPVLKQELRDALNQCRLATDRAADRYTLGQCQTITEGVRCPGTIKAVQGATLGRCRTCGGTVDVVEHQGWKIDQALHILAPLPQIIRALKSAGHLPVPAKRAEYWVKCGKLTPVRDNLYTPAAVLAAYRDTPSGRRAA